MSTERGDGVELSHRWEEAAGAASFVLLEVSTVKLGSCFVRRLVEP